MEGLVKSMIPVLIVDCGFPGVQGQNGKGVLDSTLRVSVGGSSREVGAK